MMQVRRLSTLLAAGVASATLAFPAARTAAAGPDLPSSYEATAAADGVRVSTNIPGAPLSDGLLDVSSGSAGARIDALGASRAFAAAPYPGATLTNLLDVLRGATGAPIPSYPLIAASDHPGAPESALSQPGVTLAAKSGPGVSEARLVTGADGGDAGGVVRSIGQVRTAVDEAGALVAEATMETTGVRVGPVAIGKVLSRARVTRAAGAEPQREQAVEVTGLTIGDQTVGIGPEGLVTPGTKTPLPDTDPARKALEQAGVSLRYVNVTDSPDGVVSAGLMITQVVPASPTGPPSTIVYTIGRASATAIMGAAAALPDLAGPTLPSAGESEAPPTEPSPPPAAPASDQEAAVASASSSPTPGFDAGAPPASPTLSSASPGAGVYPDVTTRPPSPEETAALEQPAPSSAPVEAPAPVVAATAAASISPASRAWSPDPLYLVMLLPGAVLLGAFLLFRRMGVKTTWAS